MHRRTFLATGLAALATMRSSATLSRGKPPVLHAQAAPARRSATATLVRRRAEELSRRVYEPPRETLPAVLAAMGYDEYRDLRFRPERAVWRGEDLGFELQFFVSAYIFRSPVEIFLVESGAIRPLTADRDLFDFGPQESKVPLEAPLSFSGFRIHAPMKREDYYDELLAFQGASYFRGLGRSHGYGLSARALSLNTAGPEPEEFPLFRSFWIESPSDQQSITVHGLLDSASVTGAYTFVIRPGEQTLMDVDAQIFPRRDLSSVGFAPLTSMFVKDTHDSDGPLDFRPAIHDSDGLAAWNGRDERLWRPLVSPPELQLSCLRDRSPKGFGLIQRERQFDAYQDLEAHYQDRPSAWIEPKGDWGDGCVQLVEIPTQAEYFDNVVAYWHPDATLVAGHAYSIGYRLTWCDDVPVSNGYRVGKTRIGEGSRPGTVRFVVDFLERPDLKPQQVASVAISDVPSKPSPEVMLSSSAGLVGKPVIQHNPDTGGIRATFEFDPQDQKWSELRLALSVNAEPASEVWLFQWRR
ncbi:MAG: glucan biosynthesis protein [Polyangiaceae bacterium]|nr:glucan biosynthesis protein [Polyangiaceae bacterium]